MKAEEAIRAIESNWPSEQYTMLCEALTLAIEALRGQALAPPGTVAVPADRLQLWGGQVQRVATELDLVEQRDLARALWDLLEAMTHEAMKATAALQVQPPVPPGPAEWAFAGRDTAGNPLYRRMDAGTAAEVQPGVVPAPATVAIPIDVARTVAEGCGYYCGFLMQLKGSPDDMRRFGVAKDAVDEALAAALGEGEQS